MININIIDCIAFDADYFIESKYSFFKNGRDPNQLAPVKPADQVLHYHLFCPWSLW